MFGSAKDQGAEMQTPSKLDLDSLDGLRQLLEAYANAHYTRIEGGFVCKSCSAQILAVETYITLHIKEWDGCAGPGRVGKAQVPYCPDCEQKPEEFGCVHLPLEALRQFISMIVLPQVSEGRLPPGY